MRQFLYLFFATILIGCTSTPVEDPEFAYTNMEQRLLAASRVSFDFRVTAEGVIDGVFSGNASVSSDGALTISAEGRFIERDLVMELVTDADSVRMVTTEMSDVVPRQDDTFNAVVIGLTRMGFLHNLAALTTVSPPEHGEGGIQEWVTVDNFEAGEIGDYSGVSFDVFVQGERTSGAVLAMVDGLPVLRRQVVAFPGGEMVVTEEYSNFVVAD